MHAAGLMLAAAASSEHNPILPSAAELVIGLVAFAILYVVLAKAVVPRFEKTFQARTEAIEGGLAKAEKAQADAQQALDSYQAQLAEARAEAARIREEAREQGAAIIAEMREQAHAEASRVTAAAQQHIEAERQAAVAALRSEVGSLAVDLSSKIVGESLSDDDRQRRVVERFIADLESGVGQAR